jgi:hypothetical protein
MRKRSAVCLALLVATAASACCGVGGGSASRTASMNGYGSGAAEMVYAHLRAGTDQSIGVNLSQTMITKPGVVYTNWTPTAGVIVGVGDLSRLSSIESFLRTQQAVVDVTEGPVPTSPPTDSKTP